VIGLFRYESTNRDYSGRPVCQSISFLQDVSEEDIFADEDAWKAAQGLGTAGAAIGGIAILFMFLGFFSGLCAKKMIFKFLIPIMFMTAGICTLLTSIAYDVDMCSDIENSFGRVVQQRYCSPAAASTGTGGAFLLYWIAGISMCWCMTPWEEPMYKFVDELSTAESAAFDSESRREKPADPADHVDPADPTEGMVEHEAATLDTEGHGENPADPADPSLGRVENTKAQQYV